MSVDIWYFQILPLGLDTFKLLKPMTHFTYHPVLTFGNSVFCPHSCIYVFCVDLRTNSHYFPIQH